jgi:TusA-related sulfurtransferase
MSPSDLARFVRSVCQCNEKAKGVAPSTAAVTGQRPQEAESVTSPLPGDITQVIDVSHLPPPLPMVRILETLRNLSPGETLVVNHTRRPIHLYPKLDALGCTHETTELRPGKIEVRITNPPARPS